MIYKFPLEVQKWIIDKKLPPDGDTLYQHRIRGTGHTAYVYLMSAKSVNLTTDRHQQQFATVASLQSSELSLNTYEPIETVKHLRHPGPSVQLSRNPGQSNIPPPKLPKPARSIKSEEPIGWICHECTYINIPTRPGCEICSADRPIDYTIPTEYVLPNEEIERIRREEEIEREMRQRAEEERSEHLAALLQTDDIDLITNNEEFDCPICFDIIPIGAGVVLRECLHMFCRLCLMGAVQHSEEAELRCPYQDEKYTCESSIQEREIRALVNKDLYQQILHRSLVTAESQEIHSYHCATTDCVGWCIYEDLVNFFECPVCKKENCLTCKAIHEGMNCKQYQEDIKLKAANDTSIRRTKEYLDLMVEQGNAMLCPQCQIIVMKKDGCDWIKCSVCKTEICWVTKGRRWGPRGEGDISDGCKCGVNNIKCHVNCGNCH
ncbi:hypothetical protein LOTGIDRAFT_109179 [Lottia gigantea]|uniref:RanBP-type and C3HC4-type zinc finger-containing protein 1 n=1 Tax=Lottia gigantea TaxID=225164 RepID=V3ZF64_LOTGI|nr:hypothetical protein LOTGIDRAFT_109179 [Lottia gigantea]ESO82757.1 hypothetical protein LOTGIDRAFT_109179 [Lottia gigantea]